MKAKLFVYDKQAVFPWYGPDGLPNGDWFFYLYDADNPPVEGTYMEPDFRFKVPIVEGYTHEVDVPLYGTDGGITPRYVQAQAPDTDTFEFAQALVEATQAFLERQ
jgi:hypothetical protein